MLKTLDKALELLSFFKEQSSWGVRELAKESGFGTTVTFRILATLESHGYIAQNEETKKYELGASFLEFNRLLQNKVRFQDLLLPFMEKLAVKTGENIFLSLLDGEESINAAIVESNHKVHLSVKPGQRKPLYAAASNLVILAYLPVEKQNQILKGPIIPVTEKTMTDPEEIRKELKKIKKQGWSITYGEYSQDVVGIGVPLFDSFNEIIGSISVAGPEYRLPDKNIRRILSITLKENEAIQQYINNLGVTVSTMDKLYQREVFV